MTIDNAIEALQALRNGHISDTYKGTRISAILSLAITALQEKQVREVGCEYCNTAVFVAYGEHPLKLKYEVLTKKHCPKCGRKLGDEIE